ncbi:MAG: methyl-accepting chemotaxis protein [Ilumatobacteraceae bacterium]
MNSLKPWLPTGTSLDDQSFEQRHRVVRYVLYANFPALLVFGLARGYDLPHTLIDMLPAAMFAAFGGISRARVVRTMATSAGLLACSGGFIHFTGGQIEAHLHVYISLVLVALYIDWRPYAAAIVAVLVHHLGVGLVAPETVFSHTAGQNKPLVWALIHAAFVVTESLIISLLWRFTTEEHERLLALMAQNEQALRDRSQAELALAEEERRAAAEAGAQLARKQEIYLQVGSESANLDEESTQVDASMRAVSNGIGELMASVGEISNSARRAAAVATAAKREADVSTATVNSLAEVSRQIGGLVATIGGVAAQTNLLALNASIEAARAGEAGRGFAVVANEVKELAGQASAVADQVGRLVASVQERTGDVVTHLEQIAGVIGDIDELQQSIAAATDQQADATRRIADTAGSAAEGAQRIVGSVHRLTELSRAE